MTTCKGHFLIAVDGFHRSELLDRAARLREQIAKMLTLYNLASYLRMTTSLFMKIQTALQSQAWCADTIVPVATRVLFRV